MDDRGTIEMIKENPYMQYFLGLSSYTSNPVFDASLFVYIRKRMGNEVFDSMNEVIIGAYIALEAKKAKETKTSKGKKQGKDEDSGSDESNSNQGKLQLDATVCDSHIKYPTDLDLLNPHCSL